MFASKITLSFQAHMTAKEPMAAFTLYTFAFQYAEHLGVAYAMIAFESSSKGAFVLHTALFHHASGIRVTCVMNCLDAFHAHLIKEKFNNGIQRFTGYTIIPPFSAYEVAYLHS
jgi:hypothetical protein